MVERMDASDWVTFIVPTAVSVAALLVAVMAARYTREQARAASDTLNMHKAEDRRRWTVWELEKIGSNEYALRNTGSRVAQYIEFDWGDLLVAGPPGIRNLPAGHAERFIVEAPLNSTTDRVTLSWITPGINGRQTGQLLL